MANVGTASNGKVLIGAGQGVSPTYASIGTNSGLTAHGVILAEGNSAFAVAAPSTSGFVLTSNGPSADPTFQTLPSSGITSIVAQNATSTTGPTVTIDGQDGLTTSITGTTLIMTPRAAGAQNMVLGESSGGGSIASSTRNVGYGFQTLTSLGSGADGNCAFGWRALQTVGGTGSNCAFGISTMTSCSSGSGNVAIGAAALQTSVSPQNNVAIGQTAMQNTASGNANVCIGAACGTGVQTSSNVFIGTVCAQAVSGGGQCVGIGYGSLMNVTGANNSAIGFQSLNNVTSGTLSVALGYQAGTASTGTDSSNIFINSPGVVGDNNICRIGAGNGSGSQQLAATFIQGISGVTVTGTAVLCSTAGQLGTIASSARYKENIEDMKEDVSILHLRPVEFSYKEDSSKSKQYGLIAEEVHQDFPHLCFYKDDQPESVKYHELPVFLLKEIQRLSARIDELEVKCKA